MFDALPGRTRQGGFLARARGEGRPILERLEDRDVPAVIGGVVYHDANHNGLFDTGEAGIPNSTLLLYDSAGHVIATAVSNPAGRYQFTARNGVSTAPQTASYLVNFPKTRTNAGRSGSLPTFDSNLGTLTSIELIAQGSLDSNVVLENLEGAATNMQARLNGSIRYQVGGATLTATPHQGLQGTLAAFDGSADLQGPSSHDFGLTHLQGTFSEVVLTNPSDLAAFTTNGPGALSVAQSAQVTSSAAGTGNLLAMIRSTVQGKVRVVYHYTPVNGIGPGNYTIVQPHEPRGYVDGMETSDNVTPIPGSNHTDFIRVGVVNNPDRLLTNNFGELRASSVAGWVYYDANRSRRLDAGDTGLAGVSIVLTGTDIWGNSVSRTTTTNAAGAYGFGGLTAGNYVIHEVQPPGYLQGTTSAGDRGGQVSGDNITMTLPEGTAAHNYNFGELLNAVTPPPHDTGPPPPVNPLPGPGKFFLIHGLTDGFIW